MFDQERYLRSSESSTQWQFDQAVWIARMFLLFNVFISTNVAMTRWETWRTTEGIVPLWPVRWINLLPPTVGIDIVCTFAVVGSVAAFFFIEYRAVRLGNAFATLFLHAMLNSFGKINHSWHMLVIISFAFVFLPTRGWSSARDNIEKQVEFLSVIWGAQLLVMLAYTMSGLWKLYGIWQQWGDGVITALNPNAFAYQIANRTLQTNTDSMLSGLIIGYPWLGWLPYLVAIYLETFAVIIVFRPNLHKFWAFMLSMFHLGTWFTLTVNFNSQLILLGLLFWYSPFAPQQFSFRALLNDLPGLRHISHWIFRNTPPLETA